MQIALSVLNVLMPVLICGIVIIPLVYGVRETQRVVLDLQRQIDDLKRELEEMKGKES